MSPLSSSVWFVLFFSVIATTLAEKIEEKSYRTEIINEDGLRKDESATDVEKREIGGNVVEKVLVKRQANGRCQSGRVRMDPHSRSGNPRIDTKWVSFSPQFSSPPTVFIGIAMIHVNNDANFRFNSWFDSVSTSGFNMYVKEWSYTDIYEVEMSWIACP